MSQLGRPPVLTETKRQRILDAVSHGFSLIMAARLVGCDRKTIRNTAERDRGFAEKLAEAESANQQRHLDNINAAADERKYWRASAWVLERREPESFGPRKPDVVSPEQVSALLKEIAEALVAEIPADRYRKNVMRKLEEIISQLQCT